MLLQLQQSTDEKKSAEESSILDKNVSLHKAFLTCMLRNYTQIFIQRLHVFVAVKESKKHNFRMPLLQKLSIVEFYTENTVSLKQPPTPPRHIYTYTYMEDDGVAPTN